MSKSRHSKGKTLNESFLAACRGGQINRVTSYLAQGADINAQDYVDFPNVGVSGNTGLMWAFYNERNKLARALLDAGAKVTITNCRGQNPLHLCDASFMDELVGKGLDVNSQDNEGRTPANTLRGVWLDVARTQKLLSLDADPYIPDWTGKNALHLVEEQLQMAQKGDAKTRKDYQRLRAEMKRLNASSPFASPR